MTTSEILQRLRSLGSPENVAGMARYGIVTKEAFGVSAPELKTLANEIKKQTEDRHALALQLWETGVHDARGVAYLIDEPKRVTAEQMDAWAGDFDNWAICDSTCGTLFSKTAHAYDKVDQWTRRDEEFVKRAGIVLMAWLAVHDKKADDGKIEKFLPILERLADDDRNFIKKAINWALRQIGKRSIELNEASIRTAERIGKQSSPSARWISSGALRELKSEAVQSRLKMKTK